MRNVIVLALMSSTLLACSSDDGGSNPASNESILGSLFMSYPELSEANNNTESLSEMTPYSLDTGGLKIFGSFEASGVTDDYFRFNTASFSTVDVAVFIDGVKQTEANSQVSIYLNSYIDDGYSTLFGNGYFINASVSPAGATDQDYVIGISQGLGSDVSGSQYIIEMHHKP